MASPCLAFRRLVCSFSQKISTEECQQIVYIRLHDCRERYRDASTLDILSKLEMSRIFSPDNPAGLIEVARDISRPDLINLVKDFMKKNQRSKDKKAKANPPSKPERTCLRPYSNDEETTQLRATLEVTLSQASVLAQQVDILQRAIVSKEKQKAAEANKEAGRAVKELAEYLKKVQEELERPEPSSQRSSTSSEEDEFGVPQQTTYTPEVSTQEHKPIPKPRRMQRPSQVSCSGQDSNKSPMQETCMPAQTLSSYFNRADMPHLRQQGTPLVDQRGIVFPRTRRWPKQSNSSSHSQSTPVSPSLAEKDSVQPKPPSKPAVPPRTRKPSSMNAPTPVSRRPLPKVTIETPLDDSGDYAVLTPVINDDDAPTTTGTGDSGFGELEQWKQHMHHPPLLEDSEEHYYKSLHSQGKVIKDGDYEDLQY